MFLFESVWHVTANPAVAIEWRKSAKEHWWYVYNLTSDHDELYNLSDAGYANVAGDAGRAAVKRAMVRRLASFLRGSPRWRCWWHALRIDKETDLPAEGGDYQMFRPE